MAAFLVGCVFGPCVVLIVNIYRAEKAAEGKLLDDELREIFKRINALEAANLKPKQ